MLFVPVDNNKIIINNELYKIKECLDSHHYHRWEFFLYDLLHKENPNKVLAFKKAQSKAIDTLKQKDIYIDLHGTYTIDNTLVFSFQYMGYKYSIYYKDNTITIYIGTMYTVDVYDQLTILCYDLIKKKLRPGDTSHILHYLKQLPPLYTFILQYIQTHIDHYNLYMGYSDIYKPPLLSRFTKYITNLFNKPS